MVGLFLNSGLGTFIRLRVRDSGSHVRGVDSASGSSCSGFRTQGKEREIAGGFMGN
jgi:hypothetical protein